jgi:hypothetical protein
MTNTLNRAANSNGVSFGRCLRLSNLEPFRVTCSLLKSLSVTPPTTSFHHCLSSPVGSQQSQIPQRRDQKTCVVVLHMLLPTAVDTIDAGEARPRGQSETLSHWPA